MAPCTLLRRIRANKVMEPDILTMSSREGSRIFTQLQKGYVMDILQRIREMYPELTRKQKEIAGLLLENPEDICYITLARLSQQAGASEVTLLRFCKKAGCANFLELKEEFRKYTQNMVKVFSAPTYFLPEEGIAGKSGKKELLHDICASEARDSANYFSSVNLDQIIAAAEAVRNSKRIFLLAHDISKILGEFLESRLKLLYLDATLIDLGDQAKTQHYLHQIASEDLVIFFAFPKYYYPLSSIAKQVDQKGAVILTITDSADSPSASCSRHLLLCRTATKVFYNSLALPMALLNLLASYLVIDMVPGPERQGFLESTGSIL